jgi:hypothetical protein
LTSLEAEVRTPLDETFDFQPVPAAIIANRNLPATASALSELRQRPDAFDLNLNGQPGALGEVEPVFVSGALIMKPSTSCFNARDLLSHFQNISSSATFCGIVMHEVQKPGGAPNCIAREWRQGHR